MRATALMVLMASVVQGSLYGYHNNKQKFFQPAESSTFQLVKLGNVNVTFLDKTNLLGYDGQDFVQVISAWLLSPFPSSLYPPTPPATTRRARANPPLRLVLVSRPRDLLPCHASIQVPPCCWRSWNISHSGVFPRKPPPRMPSCTVPHQPEC